MITTIVLTCILWALFFLMELFAAKFYPHPFIIAYFPEDVQERAKDHKPPFPSAPIIGWILCLLTIAGDVLVLIYGGWDGIRRGFSFGDHLVRFLIMGYGLKAFDILFFDYFILTKTRFFQHFYPETADCEGWKHFGYNRKDQITQLIVMLPCMLMTALLCWRLGQ